MKNIFESLDDEKVRFVDLKYNSIGFDPSFYFEPENFKQHMIEYLSKDYILVKRSDLEALKPLLNIKK